MRLTHLVHQLHCSPIDDIPDHVHAWKSSLVVRPLSIIASFICTLTGEEHSLIGIMPDYEESMTYDYSSWHERLLIDKDNRKNQARFLKFTTQCRLPFSLPSYRQECIIEVIRSKKPINTYETKSILFIIVNNLVTIISLMFYTIGFIVVVLVTIKK